ncbi:AAA-ATPase At3g28580-like [Chenopodium quinoa]|uniref:AAA-ATPase At3g28580-like n=1 Tax=Chenopodium quinoa TaxID=63459 RepID=UPI000B777549|nr:AAA-ATPase At3g28580-like [Chenopodium quinoa]
MEMFSSQFGSGLAGLMFIWTIYRHYLPPKLHEAIEYFTSRYTHKLASYFSPYLDITFDEYSNRFNRNEAYDAIQSYLGDKSSTEAKSMNADYDEDAKSLLIKLGNNEEIMDEYNGVQVWWSFVKQHVEQTAFSYFRNSNEKRHYTLVFHAKHRKFIMDKYLPYVLEEGEAITNRNRRRKLYTNGDDEDMWDNYIDFKHPARFGMLAMEEDKKQMILEDLQWFKGAKDYYAQIGKPWKRGYLLYGPPGTGKSTLVAAMANLLDYDIYDLELTAVKNNKQLRRLLIETTCKSIILIEDIDCSLDLTGQRTEKKEEEEKADEKDPLKNKPAGEKEAKDKKKKGSDVTLSGLLNFIDGIWSACGEERIIVFTTNHVDKLDPALIRPGRMDLHIELSYCRYEAFKMLAKNYLRLESHPLFETIGTLLEEIDVTPADVAENIMPRSVKATTAEDCLKKLVVYLEKAKQAKKLKAEQELVLKGEEKSASGEISGENKII